MALLLCRLWSFLLYTVHGVVPVVPSKKFPYIDSTGHQCVLWGPASKTAYSSRNKHSNQAFCFDKVFLTTTLVHKYQRFRLALQYSSPHFNCPFLWKLASQVFRFLWPVFCLPSSFPQSDIQWFLTKRLCLQKVTKWHLSEYGALLPKAIRSIVRNCTATRMYTLKVESLTMCRSEVIGHELVFL